MATPGRRALIIGINTYPGLPPERHLHGCVNDAMSLEALLRDRFGFPRAQITSLLDQQATRQRILDAFDELVASTATDDVVVITYSGHGCQRILRAPPAGPGQQSDQTQDESIVPSDGLMEDESAHIFDDEIHRRLILPLAARTRFTTLIFDSCHSGTISRDADLESFAGRSRRLPPVRREVPRLPQRPPGPAPEARGPSGWFAQGDAHLLLAACRDDEDAREDASGALTQGAFTARLIEAIQAAPSGATYGDIFEAASPRVTARFSAQHPQMEGRGARKLFGVEEITVPRYVTVRGRKQDTVTLAAGLAHGLTAGSEWALFRPGDDQLRPEGALGRIKLTDLSATTAAGKLLPGAQAFEIAENSRAVEMVHEYGEQRLRVHLDPAAPADAAQALRAVLSASPLLSLSEGDGAEVLVRAEQGPAGDPGWAVIDRGGVRIFATALAAHAALRGNLEKEARYRHALGLANADPKSALRDKVQMVLLRRAGAGWEPLPPESGGLAVVHDGDELAVDIRNDHDAPIFFSLIDFGVSGAVQLLYPFEASSERLPPQHRVRLFGDGELRLEVPAAAGRDTEVFKLFVTAEQTDLRPLTQGAFESTRAVMNQDFATVERPFLLRRR